MLTPIHQQRWVLRKNRKVNKGFFFQKTIYKCVTKKGMNVNKNEHSIVVVSLCFNLIIKDQWCENNFIANYRNILALAWLKPLFLAILWSIFFLLFKKEGRIKDRSLIFKLHFKQNCVIYLNKQNWKFDPAQSKSILDASLLEKNNSNNKKV